MALPWLCVIVVEYAVLSRFLRGDLRFPGRAAPQGDTAPPRFALVTLRITLAAMALSEPFGVHPAWAAAAGAVTLAVPWVGRRPAQWGHLLAATNPGFCVFVLALGVVVLGVRRNGPGAYLAAVTPTTTTLAGLLAAATLAAVLANLLNNLVVIDRRPSSPRSAAYVVSATASMRSQRSIRASRCSVVARCAGLRCAVPRAAHAR